MSLVEQALKKMAAARAGSLEVRKPAIPAARGVPEPDRPPPIEIKPARTVILNRAGLVDAGMLPPPAEERVLAEEYRQIKRPLVDKALGREQPAVAGGRLIMVAGALPGDGKTFTSVNLALSLAMEKDVSIVLVDADVAKPHISRLFGVQNDPGLLDLLRDERLNVESLILPTDVAGLSILPAGKPSETATELLASSRMRSLMAEIGSGDANRLVLFDSPPLLLTTEARVLASAVGQIVLVIAAGKTPQKAVFDALEMLDDQKAIGLVMNQSEEARRSGYYAYYGRETETATES